MSIEGQGGPLDIQGGGQEVVLTENYLFHTQIQGFLYELPGGSISIYLYFIIGKYLFFGGTKLISPGGILHFYLFIYLIVWFSFM